MERVNPPPPGAKPFHPHNTGEWQRYDPGIAAGRIIEKDPDRTVLSWSRLAASIWDWLSLHYEIPEFMPPLVIDHSHRGGKRIGEDGSFHQLAGEIRSHWLAFGEMVQYEDEKVYSKVQPISYECRIYHRNLVRWIRLVFGKKCPALAVKVLMTHVLCHEFSHHIRNTDAMFRYYESNESGNGLEIRVTDLYDYFKKSHMDDEWETESMAMTFLLEFVLDTILDYRMARAGEVVIGGRYDMFMRKRHPEWNVVMCILEFIELDNQISVNPSPVYTIEEISRRQRRLIRSISKLFPDDLEWAIID